MISRTGSNHRLSVIGYRLSANTENRAPSTEAAFTLVELLLSVAILGFGLCIVLQAYISALSGLDASQNYLEAALFAEEKISGLAISAYENDGLAPEIKTGQARPASRKFDWASEVGEIQAPGYLSEDFVMASVSLDWRQRNSARNFALATYLPKRKEEKDGRPGEGR